MSVIKISLSLFLALALLSLSGCERGFSLFILQRYKPKLVFCLTTGDWYCDGRGIQLNTGITIYKVDSAGNHLDTVWEMEAGYGDIHANVVSVLAYGQVPTGWTVTVPAKPILPNTYYRFDDRAYFVGSASGDYKVISREDFWDRAWRIRGPNRQFAK